MLKFIKLNIFLLLTGVLLNAQPTCQDVIEKHLEVTGLSGFMKDVKQYYINGVFLQNKMNLPIKIQANLPDKYRMDLYFNNLDFIKISNGNTKWEYNPMQDTLLTKTSNENEAIEFASRWTGGLYQSSEDGVKLSMLGITKIEDIETYKIKVVFGEKIRVYFIDKLSYLILRIDDDLDEKKVTYYSDYRKIGQYLFPFSLIGYEGGIPATSMKFSEVKINEKKPDSIFSKPGKG